MRLLFRVVWCFSLYYLFLALAPADVDAEAAKGRDISISVRVSPESSFVTSITFQTDRTFIKEITRARTKESSCNPHWVRATMTIHKNSYWYDHDGRLYDPQKSQLLLISAKTRQQMEQYVQIVEQAHYGNPLPWDQVRKSFQRMENAAVVDLETGQRFMVQRRAGSRHADVQPLTRTDTRIMKEIYQGKWSWKRRAILVEVDGKYFAASMHGMPHGAGAIRGNDFPGHFCIHFFGSSTHRRTEPDPSHSLMILKSSGLLAQTLARAEPQELISYFLTSLNEHDHHTLKMTTSGFSLPESLLSVQNVKRPEEIPQSEEAGLFFVAIPVHVDYVGQNGRGRSGTWRFLLHREAPWERWRIVGVQMD
ncbi:hypothetical protein [Brevibacillus panacihumi]|uniref:Uncharacterized protein n=1 Tax=Brevibacillus panacihumi TaxID=497735 RepID=A0A3M8DF60_9BACL|nr:hypothetical protein [Brevibacillus panacihumi]RNB86229.1 hypothetical protein EDM58_01375 [Brevibacillus panacihumi]